MNKLLIVTTVPATIDAFLFPYVHYFRTKGWRVDAMAQGISTNTNCLEAFDRVWEVEWSRNPLQLQNLMVAPQQIRQVVEQEGYDLVHVHTPVAAFVTRYALKNLRKRGQPKVIYTAHGFHFYRGGKLLKNAAFLSLEKLAGAWTDYLIVINREDEAAAKRYQIVPDERLRYTPGIGVDCDRYSSKFVSDSEIQMVRQELGLAPNAPLFLSIAELNPGKRHQDILQALAQLRRSDVHLALAGTGPQQAKLQQLAFQLGIAEQIHFLGYRRDIPALIRASVATVLASEREGLPRSIMESLCLETPAIGTKIRGIQDLLAEGCGLLVKVGDVKGLTEAMAHILDRPEEVKLMGQRGKERMNEYELQKIIEMYEQLYAEALGQKIVEVKTPA
ncbi:MAG: putative glycosyltransferase EpsD [Chroococcidiopsis cubana SAG 39.79]|jgi:glycosyltransferase involved in cell wall biosynthesis|uniref:Glycosyl transferase group 1 n=2 Tax=Chroococcidiopsis TaxID=54298 RepID=K9TXK6_CHRTP|nr:MULTISPECIES: glycosyltransferase family 4 protein [Chroococcidiopsis]AFY86729.1 glycosyl transferase group 1 [Chroococcidiopsis thermalis PCC 7203]MDZ4874007.1 putative glycosyltransferase EpsD [Chroococcidiopsis cubana SAG 39.79]PSB58357.1 glycosyltransferase family 1 protein [Chroococcidiopsis cubana CCALA 043]RUT11036.1 glycosyl transferase family 1 [Chroococcidiopsis cubana SAG 39.79]